MRNFLLRSTCIATSILFGISLASYANTEKYRLTLRDNPATTITIGWNQVSGSNPVVYYGTTDYGTNYSYYSNSKTVDRSVYYKGMNNQFARLTGLKPNTAYYFVIRDSQGTSKRYWFKTAPSSSSEKLSFVAGGDSRNNRTPRQNANRIVARLRPHAVLFGGDMTSSGTESEWQDWFDDWQLTIGSDGRMIPIIAARGNHESSNSMVYTLFDTPSSDVYYAITFGTDLFRAYTLNTEMSISGNQTSWLANDLARNSNVTWKSAQYHKPMRPHVSSKSEGNTQYSSWANLFYQNNVKLVVECDAHTVKTTWPVRPSTSSGSDEGFVRDDVNGTVYTGEGCWGAPLRSNNDNKAWTRNSGMFNQVKWIFIEKSKIEVRTVRVDNAYYVGTVSDNNIFTAPSNLDIWSPSNGSVVTIRNANAGLPDIGLISPADQQYYTSPQTITLSASASDSDGSISSVRFYINGNYVGQDYTTPYQVNYAIPSDGNYTFTAIAEDNEGNSKTSETRTFNVGVVQNTINVRISSGDDDVEESSGGTMYTNSSDIELVYDGSNQTVGLRFQDLAIPQGATINTAYIQFTTDETGGSSGTLTIRAEDVSNSSAFSTSSYNVSGRSKTSASVNWSPSSWSSVGQSSTSQRTPNLKTLIQEVVDRSGWSSGNNMTFIINGTGERTAEAYEGSSSSAALLTVSYTYGNTTTPPDFHTLSISASNGIVSKSPNQNSFEDGTNVTLSATPNNGYEFIGWSGSLSGSQNPVTVTMNADKSITANFRTIDNDTDPVEVTISKRVISSYDDAEEAENGTMYLNSSDLELVYDSHNSAGYQKVGIRFQSLNIPNGANITGAYIQFTVDENINNSGTLSIYAQDQSNADYFSSSSYDISYRPKTSAYVNWNPSTWSTVGSSGSAQRTPDLKSLVQEVVNRSAWTAGNPMAFIIEGYGRRVAESYDGSSSAAPLLVVTYESAPGSNARKFVEFEEAKEFIAYPNPMSHVLNLEFEAIIPGQVQISFFDASGKLVKNHGATITVGHNKVKVVTEGLKAGTYTAQIIGAGISKTIKLIK
ncbi:Ig-like domain-containing protein [Flammeovirga sp. SJP92]|uniref:Ig-like domain-containing protein n=1 Tax=Flammeovirga sp. SJP92 TaxID=1775430 RepID=UPI0009ED5F44|nr:Ig-like domain-containing protein [Flammeovirga sp. SJP92]